jgi:hypothetical protein
MQVFTGNAETTPLALMLKDNVPVFCSPDQFSRNIYFVDDSSCLLVSSLTNLFYTTSLHRYIYIYQYSGMITRFQRGCDNKAE